MFSARFRRPYVYFASLVATASVFCGHLPLCLSAAESNPASRRPNIIFIIADDMRPEMCNFLPQGAGKNLSPSIDRLAREGVVMQRQYVVSPVCTPSRYNCLTGRYASRARNAAFLHDTLQANQTIVTWNTFITPEDVTLGRLLQQAGYVTGFVGKNHVVEAEGLATFKWEADPRDPEVVKKLKNNAEKLEDAIRKCGFDYAENIYHNNPDFLGIKKLSSHNLDWITQAGVDFIEANHDQPFFLYFATTVPHGPNEPERSWNADPCITAEGYLDEPPHVQPARETIPTRLKQAGLAPGNNKGNVLWLDDAVGALMGTLEKYGLDENTIIFFFNDHGQTAKGTLYQGGIVDPSVVWKKGGFPCGPACDVAVSNIDFAPTILDLVGATPGQQGFDGRSFAPALQGDKTPIHESLYFEMGFSRAVIQGDYKFLALRYPEAIANMSTAERQRRLDDFNAEMERRGRPLSTADISTPFSHISAIPGGGDAERESTAHFPAYYDADQLYNLGDDPTEQKNLVGDSHYAESLKKLQATLKRYITDLPGQFGEFGTEHTSTAAHTSTGLLDNHKRQGSFFRSN